MIFWRPLFNYQTSSHGRIIKTMVTVCTTDVIVSLIGVFDEFLVSKETVVLRRWERSKQKFGFIKRVDKG